MSTPERPGDWRQDPHRQFAWPLYRHFRGNLSENHTAANYPIRTATTIQSPSNVTCKKSESDSSALIVREVDAKQNLDFVAAVMMTKPCHRELMADLTSQPPEQAGLLFGPANYDLLVTHYVPELYGRSTSVTFEIDGDFVNRTIARFKSTKLDLKGIVHSHPGNYDRLSPGDLAYIDRVLGNPKNKVTKTVFMPLVCESRFIPFLVDSNMSVIKPQFTIV